ncbi:MAG TPA: hypothetical protein VJB87_00705 [Candidatus Nanoarchaeia archaeon]|nr:hypothetical protein [Candidatus Nanoarchaeia archaeon]
MGYMTIQLPDKLLKKVKKYSDDYWNKIVLQAITKRIELAKASKN